MAPFRLARPRFFAVFALEGAVIFAVLFGLGQLTLQLTRDATGSLRPTVLVIGALFTVLLLVTEWTRVGDQDSRRREIVLFSVMSAVLGVLSWAVVWGLAGSHRNPAGLMFLEGAVAVPVAIGAWRWLTGRLDVLNLSRETVLIVGAGEAAREACRWIVRDHNDEYAVLGFADESETREGTILAMGKRIQTSFEGLSGFAAHRVDRVIVALDEKRGKLPVRQLMELRLRGIEIEEATSFFERVSGKIAVETMLPSWLIFSDGFKSSSLKSLLKRVADIVLSLLLLLVSAPLMLLTTLAILLESGAPVFYRQARMGRDGEEFDVLKFRSMFKDAERKSGPTWAQENDPRITRVGRWIRTLRIDELPQLFNVLRGEMSFVGPRPERGHFVRKLEQKIPYFGLRLTARPGITGWAQVEYHYGASEEDALEKLKYDLYYIKNNNLFFDLWIVLKTIKVVLLGSGAR